MDNTLVLPKRCHKQSDNLSIPHGYRAVSYTHLDVYKRQAEGTETDRSVSAEAGIYPSSTDRAAQRCADEMCIRDRRHINTGKQHGKINFSVNIAAFRYQGVLHMGALSHIVWRHHRVTGINLPLVVAQVQSCLLYTSHFPGHKYSR